MEIDVQQVMDLVTLYGMKILTGIVIFIIGRWLARILRRVAERALIKGQADQIVISFVGNIVYVAVLVFAIVAALGTMGIETASFAAVIAAAGLAIGLALQGSLSNFAAGFLLAIFRPFKTGDYIEAGGTAGVVEQIEIFTTRFRTPDNKIIIVPNGAILGGNITNYSTMPTRRVDFVFGIGYGDDIDKAREVLNAVIAADERIHQDPEPMVVVSELGDSSVNFTVRVWADAGNYWPLKFALTETVKKKFDEAGVSIPFPQRDVHLYQADAA